MKLVITEASPWLMKMNMLVVFLEVVCDASGWAW